MRNSGYRLISLLAVCAMLLSTPGWAQSTSSRRRRRRRAAGDRDTGDFKASRLLRQAEDYLAAKETERGVKMLQTIIDQYPQSFVRHQAWLAMGKHYMSIQQPADAIRALNNLKALAKADEELQGEQLDVYLEGMYNIGVAQYDSRQYSAAFPVLRKITRDYPNTIWANQAFYYIGMCHFRMENWTKCIEALSLVGTSVDGNDQTMQFVEAGHRFYMKISDSDLPIMHRLGKPVKIQIKTKTGDSEEVTCIPLNRAADVFLGSIPTKVAKVDTEQMGDGVLQVIGGDEITTEYIDENTFKGERDIPRKSTTTVVSTGRVDFTLGTYAGKASAAFLGQPVFTVVRDADIDRGPEANKLRVKIVSQFKEEVEDDEGSINIIDLDRIMEEERRERWTVRDEVEVELTELPTADTEAAKASIHTGRFGGNVMLIDAIAGVEVDQADDKLACKIGDQIMVTYVDSLHIMGRDDRSISAKLIVSGKIKQRASADQDIVEDPKLRTEKNLVEAEALLELGRIFRDMGLMQGAEDKCKEGIEKLVEILKIKAPLPPELVEKTYRIKWESEMVMNDYGAAIATCRQFNNLYPNSPLVDRALKEIGMIHLGRKDYRAASEIFRQILNLANSQIKAEAQFRLAECAEKSNKKLSAAIPLYQTCAERYPDSEFAGPALAKQIEYLFETKDYPAADALLERIFEEHPDAEFLDSMLIKWVLVAYKMRNYRKAYEKCSKLVFEYPSSPYASKAKKILQKLEPKVKGAGEGEG